MADLENQARALGIKIDARWGDERLQQEIDKRLGSQAAVSEEIPMAADAAPPKVVDVTPGPSPVSIPETVKTTGGKTIDVTLKVDYWPTENERKLAGETVAVPLKKARELVAQGKAERAMPEDGDDE